MQIGMVVIILLIPAIIAVLVTILREDRNHET